MKKRYGRKSVKRQRQLLIFSMVGIFCFFSVGYAAFSSNFLISGKRTVIKDTFSLERIKRDLATQGSGLYEDSYEINRYVYRGLKPDNYIEFNDELWRILSLEADGTIKIIRDKMLGQTDTIDNLTYKEFDTANARTTTKNTYCSSPVNGCGVFAAVTGTVSTHSGLYSGTVTGDSTLKKYLNDTYYTSLSTETKANIASHTFNIGIVEMRNVNGGDTLERNIEGEKRYTWTGNVGLINVTDVLKASLNDTCISATDGKTAGICNNYLLRDRLGVCSWAINAISVENSNWSYLSWIACDGANGAYVGYNRAYINDRYGVRPVVYLKAGLNLSGRGTEREPYEIE